MRMKIEGTIYANQTIHLGRHSVLYQKGCAGRSHQRSDICHCIFTSLRGKDMPSITSKIEVINQMGISISSTVIFDDDAEARLLLTARSGGARDWRYQLWDFDGASYILDTDEWFLEDDLTARSGVTTFDPENIMHFSVIAHMTKKLGYKRKTSTTSIAA